MGWWGWWRWWGENDENDENDEEDEDDDDEEEKEDDKDDEDDEDDEDDGDDRNDVDETKAHVVWLLVWNVVLNVSDRRRLSTIITVLRMTFIFFGDGLKTTIQLVLPDNSQEAPIIAKIHVVFSGRFDLQQSATT